MRGPAAFLSRPLLELKLAGVISAELSRNQADAAAVLRVVARHLPTSTEGMLVEPMPKTIAEWVYQHHALLLLPEGAAAAPRGAGPGRGTIHPKHRGAGLSSAVCRLAGRGLHRRQHPVLSRAAYFFG